MSYILDALKKADAKRDRGTVPGLHARQVAPAPAPRTPTGRKGAWLALVAGLVLAGMAFVLLEERAPVAPVTPAPPPVAFAPVPTASITAALVAPPAPIAKPEPRTPPKAVVPAASSSAKPATPASAGVPTATAAPAPLLSELPVDIRGQIPALAINGSVYSDNPSQRLLLINGLVLPQGSQVAPDVTLVEIQRGSSEFTFRGTRFRLAH
ncbi:MAG: general secretion pathway protein GspB [Betaproteobacteria bacterium]|nr:general secretion pathway protein GspB [Betaproteobacteria bacterium]